MFLKLWVVTPMGVVLRGSHLATKGSNVESQINYVDILDTISTHIVFSAGFTTQMRMTLDDARYFYL